MPIRANWTGTLSEWNEKEMSWVKVAVPCLGYTGNIWNTWEKSTQQKTRQWNDSFSVAGVLAVHFGNKRNMPSDSIDRPLEFTGSDPMVLDSCRLASQDESTSNVTKAAHFRAISAHLVVSIGCAHNWNRVAIKLFYISVLFIFTKSRRQTFNVVEIYSPYLAIVQKNCYQW